MHDLQHYENYSVAELEKEIKLLDLRQNAIKILINAFYGAFGNKFFYFSNLDIAQSITAQGQDLIKFSVKAMNHFFRNKWHLDKALHEKLGIGHLKVNQITKDAVIYVDTDSNYVWFHPAIQSVEGLPPMTDEETLEFVLKLDEHGIRPYLKAAFSKYAAVFNTDNRQDFELENISRYAVWMAKKNYALQVWYEDNGARRLLKSDKRYKIIKGLETVKSSYPVWAREKLARIQDMFLERGLTINIEDDIVPVLQELKAEFLKLDLEQMCFNYNLNEFEKYIVSLKDLEFAKGTTPNPRGAAFYNHLLIKTGNQKYNSIRERSKIKQYWCNIEDERNENKFDCFCFPPGEYPAEFAPPIDMDEQFFKLIIEPVNRFLEAYGWPELNKQLNRTVEVVKPRTRKPIPKEDMYPYYVVNNETFEYVEVDSRLNEYLENQQKHVPVELNGLLLMTISKYGMDSLIVPKCELDKHIKRRKKKLGILVEEPKPEKKTRKKKGEVEVAQPVENHEIEEVF